MAPTQQAQRMAPKQHAHGMIPKQQAKIEPGIIPGISFLHYGVKQTDFSPIQPASSERGRDAQHLPDGSSRQRTRRALKETAPALAVFHISGAVWCQATGLGVPDVGCLPSLKSSTEM